MKPNDDNGRLPTAERPLRVMIIAGSQRRQYNCPGVDSKSRTLMLRMAERLPQDWEIDFEDLGNVFGRARIQSCNACVSTAMSLCVWPCNCYERDNKEEPDLMWDLDMYARLDLADAWAIVAPVNWYGPTSNLKAMFDRLVCMNGGNPKEELIEHKNPELAMKLEHAPEWKDLSLNHLEGRSAAFYCYIDDGGTEIGADGRPKTLRHKDYFDPDEEPFADQRDAYAPIVWQCRYGGIEVPDDLWAFARTGVGAPYSDNQAEDMVQQADFMQAFDAWTDRFAAHVANKGKVEPGRYRAYGYKPHGHRLADWKLKWRGLRMRAGLAPAASSPRAQQELGLNRDATFDPKMGEGQKLRD
ncbi:MAG: NAD(P)H-dependent oxidoreductase [Pseudolabrys sp.]